jgi:hypothetical protein
MDGSGDQPVVMVKVKGNGLGDRDPTVYVLDDNQFDGTHVAFGTLGPRHAKLVSSGTECCPVSGRTNRDLVEYRTA